MRPILSVDNIANGLAVYAEPRSNFCVSQPFFSHLSDGYDIYGFKLCIIISFSDLTRASSLSDHIGCIICRSSEKQMCGIDTSWIIAMVANKHSLWYFSKSHFPRESVCQLWPSVQLYCPVSCACFPRNPVPALKQIRSVYFAPKSCDGIEKRSRHCTAMIATESLAQAFIVLTAIITVSFVRCPRHDRPPISRPDWYVLAGDSGLSRFVLGLESNTSQHNNYTTF